MGYMAPFARGTRISQEFGANATKYNLSGAHTGRDYAVPIGTSVYAAGDGIIEAAQEFTNYNNEWLLGPFGGNCLVLNCGDNEPTFVYAHLSEFRVKKGDRVTKGQIIADSGKTGAATGPHCHAEQLPPRWNVRNGTYGRINPTFTEYPEDMKMSDSEVNAIVFESNKQEEETRRQDAAREEETRTFIREEIRVAFLDLRTEIQATADVDRQFIPDRVKENLK